MREGFFAALPLMLGFALDALVGDPHFLPHPVRLMGKMITGLEKPLRRLMPARAAGAALTAIMLLTWTLAPAAALVVFYKANLWLGMAAESVMCCYMLAARCLRDESMKVCQGLEKGDVEEARRAVSMIVGRDTDCLGRDGITRAAVETVAENTSDGVTAPLFWMAVGGAPLGFFYKAANTMDSMIGYKNERYIDFGKAAARLDDILNLIPSRLTALTMIFSAKIAGLDRKNAFRIWRRDRLKHDSPNSAQTEAVMAGALGVELAGDARYFGVTHKKPVIGDGLRPIEAGDIRRANRLMYVTSVLTLIAAVIFRALIAGVMS